MDKSLPRIDFVLLVDVREGNPNGDPGNANHPRVDPHTGEGLISDACFKRKIRDYVKQKYGHLPGYEIYQNRDGILLSTLHKEAGGLPKEKEGKASKASRDQGKQQAMTRLCARFWDVRVFGALAVGDYDAGAARGAVQITFGRSLHPIQITLNQMTRIATTNEKDEKSAGAGVFNAVKHVIRYAVYRFQGTIMPYQAERTGVTAKDIEILLEAMTHCWRDDMSAARGIVSPLALLLARHESADGNAPMGLILQKMQVKLTREIPLGPEDVILPTLEPMPGVTFEQR